jgi:hypothetical protein
MRQPWWHLDHDTKGTPALTPSPWPARRWLLTSAAFAMAVLIGVVTAMWAEGRGNRLGPAADRSTSSSSSVPAPPRTTGPPADPTTTRGKGGPVLRVIQWINEHAPLGGGATGSADEAFATILDGDCRRVLTMIDTSAWELGGPVRSVYEGAAAACLAAFDAQPKLWPRAEAAAARVAGHASRLHCEELAVHRLLGRLLQAHRDDPDARLTRGPLGARRALACSRFTRITPDHGPAEGGYPVRIIGDHLPGTVGVNFGTDAGHHVEVAVKDGALTLTMPPARVTRPSDRTVLIWPDGAPGWFPPAAVHFTYDRPATTRSSASTTTSSTTPTQPPPSRSTTPPPPSS